MSASRPLQMAVGLMLGCGAHLAAPTAARAAESSDITAVTSRVSSDYVRAKLPNGSFQAEEYAFGEGGHWGGPILDNTIERLKFADVARTIAVPLARQNYLPAKDPRRTKLLIMVYWGTTVGTSDSSSSPGYQNAQASQASTLPGAQMAAGAKQPVSLVRGDDFQKGAPQTMDPDMVVVLMAENQQRDMADVRNIMMLGYDSALPEGGFGMFGIKHDARTWTRDDLISEIEANRYFVVLMAYDFQRVWKEKKHKLLWETRFSIRERGNDFGKALPAMAQYASRYFGEDSHGLIRNPLPDGHVELGDLKSLGSVPEK